MVQKVPGFIGLIKLGRHKLRSKYFSSTSSPFIVHCVGGGIGRKYQTAKIADFTLLKSQTFTWPLKWTAHLINVDVNAVQEWRDGTVYDTYFKSEEIDLAAAKVKIMEHCQISNATCRLG